MLYGLIITKVHVLSHKMQSDEYLRLFSYAKTALTLRKYLRLSVNDLGIVSLLPTKNTVQ